jgi:hypothetical protein
MRAYVKQMVCERKAHIRAMGVTEEELNARQWVRERQKQRGPVDPPSRAGRRYTHITEMDEIK